MIDASTGLIVQEVAYAGLDALRAALPLDLCAYLHLPAAVGPQLYLRCPDLSSLEATEAFDLFTSFRDASAAPEPGGFPLQVAGYTAFAVLTMGAASRGLFVLGRRSGLLDPADEAVITGVSQAIGTAAHAVEAMSSVSGSGGFKVNVSVDDSHAKAEVVLTAGGGARAGKGEGSSPIEAVAQATLDALDCGIKLVGVSAAEAGDERVILALVSSDDTVTVGVALSGADPLLASAEATADAANRLAAGGGRRGNAAGISAKTRNGAAGQ